MSERPSSNPWKLATYVLAGCIVAVLGAGVVIAQRSSRDAGATLASAASGNEAAVPAPATPQSAPPPSQPEAEPKPAPTPRPAPVARASTRPTASDIESCNRYASARRNKTLETAKNALVGGALGAALGAAGGAIADGGDGAGKGAAIGGLVGVAGGTVYGIDKNNKADASARAAYEACMERRGYL
jgi:hypothetical protein